MPLSAAIAAAKVTTDGDVGEAHPKGPRSGGTDVVTLSKKEMTSLIETALVGARLGREAMGMLTIHLEFETNSQVLPMCQAVMETGPTYHAFTVGKRLHGAGIPAYWRAAAWIEQAALVIQQGTSGGASGWCTRAWTSKWWISTLR